MPKVSVVMPVHNREMHVGDAIQSILDQTFHDWELLLINDASTDATKEIIQGYASQDTRIKVVNLDQNIGVSGARNIGHELAKGTYIAVLDSDDLAHPNRLARQVDYLEQHKQVVLVSSDTQYIGYHTHLHSPPPTNQSAQVTLLKGNCYVHSSLMLRHDTLKKHAISYQSGYDTAEDYRLITQMANVGKLARIPEILVTYLTHNNQLSVSHADIQSNHAHRIRLAYWQAAFPNLSIDLEALTNLFIPQTNRLSIKIATDQVRLCVQTNALSGRFDGRLFWDLAVEMMRTVINQNGCVYHPLAWWGWQVNPYPFYKKWHSRLG